MHSFNELDQLAVNAIRILSAESVQKAKSGHPGKPMGSAPMAYTLWSHFLKHNPRDPHWINRDRFVLSAGHASMLLYSLLYLFGYGLTLDDLKAFRQWGSRTPGHPEYGHTPGVETTSGPLGQGLATAVGMAMAEAHLGARFNRPGFPVFDHFTYVLCGDGCMMEGVAAEAASLAGTQKLGKLIVLYDDNDISIEGSTDTSFTEDVGLRHEAYGWQVLKVADGNDLGAIAAALAAARADLSRPSLIIVRTQIACGSPLAGQARTHGEPLGEENVVKTREALNWPYTEPFHVPPELLTYMEQQQVRLADSQAEWQKIFKKWQEIYPELAGELMRCFSDELPELAEDARFWDFSQPEATRSASGKILNLLADCLPNLIGGSADLAPSTKTELKGKGWFAPDNYAGANIHFGVREFAMAAITNGLILHGGLRAFCSTFFVFSDYLKAALRLSALMELPAIYVLTHDSIGVGEDGPTHEPVEQLAALRATPNVCVWRPADGKETAAGYIAALQRKGPTVMVLSRQNLPVYESSGPNAFRGGYVLSDMPDPRLILIATGSEVELAVKVQAELSSRGIASRVVSMPSMEVFNAQDEAYRNSVLPPACRARIAIEAGSSQPWYQYVGLDGAVVGLDHFGASAPSAILFEQFGFNVPHVVAVAEKILHSCG
jgi:transketolase